MSNIVLNTGRQVYDFSETKFRCHSLGMIMTEPKGKSDKQKYEYYLELLGMEQGKYDAMTNKSLKMAENKLKKIQEVTEKVALLSETKNNVYLSRTCRSYLINTYALERYQRQKIVTTPAMMKGIIAEDDSIQLYNAVMGTNYKKNTKRIENEFISGVIDIHDGGDDILSAQEVIDIKTAQDIITFLAHIDEDIQHSNYWQLQGYMALSGAKTGTIAHTLVNTPETLINDEKRRLLFNMNVVSEEDIDYQLAAAKLEYNLTYNDIPKDQRMICVSVDRDDEKIVSIYEKVLACRLFLNEFAEKHMWFTKHHRKHSFLASVEELAEVD